MASQWSHNVTSLLTPCSIAVHFTCRMRGVGAKCRLFAYGPAEVTAVPKPRHLLPHLHPQWIYLSGTGLPRFSWKRGRYCPLGGIKQGCDPSVHLSVCLFHARSSKQCILGPIENRISEVIPTTTATTSGENWRDISFHCHGGDTLYI